jgi:hypothetical protein
MTDETKSNFRSIENSLIPEREIEELRKFRNNCAQISSVAANLGIVLQLVFDLGVMTTSPVVHLRWFLPSGSIQNSLAYM